MKHLVSILLLLTVASSEKCRVCLQLSTENIFLSTIFSPLFSSTTPCSPETPEVECEGKSPHCITAKFNAEDAAIGVQIGVKVAMCGYKPKWEEVIKTLEKTPDEGLANFKVTGATKDVDVWTSDIWTKHDEM